MINKRPHIIAEAGTNHGGDENIARNLVDIAKEAGADSVKFQIIYPEGLYVPKIYNNGDLQNNEVLEVRRSMMLEDNAYHRLNEYCRQEDIPMSASIFDEKGLSLLNDLNPPYIKIASCDLNNSYLINKAAETGKKIIISTGMASMKEIEQAVNNISLIGNDDIVLMHCVSIYPCPVDKINLGFIDILKSEFSFPLGFSDHTESSIAAIAAVAKGVEWIEKHFTYNRKAEGFDHAYAMEPEQLKSYVEDIDTAVSALQKPDNKIQDSENEVKQRARRGLYAARDICEGEVLDENDILIVRPENALCHNDITKVVGKKAANPISQFQPLSWQDIS